MSRVAENLIAWVDLGTTGTDERVDPILEVALILTDASPELVEITRKNVVVDPISTHPDWIHNMDDFVFRVHTKNGLLDEIQKDHGSDMLWTDEFISSALQFHGGSGSVPLAGSGVAHFDSRFIQAQMPRTASRLTYWTYDVGMLRRVMGLAGVEGRPELTTSKTHRAMDDISLHVEEMRFYLAKLKGL